jgi:hypothetical protein
VIVAVFPPEEQEPQWKLTLRNAEDFLWRHEEKGCTFTPMSIAQGPSIERYAKAICRLVEVGYTHLALGGLAPPK